MAIGPHPPPPKASVNAAAKPRGTRAFEEGFFVRKCNVLLNANLYRIMKPRDNNMNPTMALRGFPDTLVHTYAPVIPPMTPGINKWKAMLRSTLPNFKCALPETNVVNISAVWTLALARAGYAPIEIKAVVELTP